MPPDPIELTTVERPCSLLQLMTLPSQMEKVMYGPSYFKSSCDTSNQSYCGLPDWVSEVMPCPDIEMEFDMSAITPGQVKRTLKKCSTSSSPGADQTQKLL